MKFSWLWRHPKPQEVIEHQLQTAEHDWLIHQSSAEYHAAMASMLQERIRRLRNVKTPDPAMSFEDILE
jgi:hypothetical protein